MDLHVVEGVGHKSVDVSPGLAPWLCTMSEHVTPNVSVPFLSELSNF